jgi:hypothetical protein
MTYLPPHLLSYILRMKHEMELADCMHELTERHAWLRHVAHLTLVCFMGRRYDGVAADSDDAGAVALRDGIVAGDDDGATETDDDDDHGDFELVD